MDFRIADTFTTSLGKLTHEEQKAAKLSAFELQMNPASPGLQLHRIDKSKDPNFWSVRVNRDIRIIVHKTAASFLLAYVDHHDDAYKWAERRRIEAHPKTGAIQIVEVRERVENFELPMTQPFPAPAQPVQSPPKGHELLRPFALLSPEKVLAVGVPPDWISDVLGATEDGFFVLADHLPSEASEALLEYVSTGILKAPTPVIAANPFEHPDAMRRFRVVENVEELELALNAPWEKWTVFLHPSQQAIVDKSFAGPARVTGSAGTGKTIVALHRAVGLAKDPKARVLLTTFSEPLALALQRKLTILTGGNSSVIPRVTIASFIGIGKELYQIAFGHKPAIATEELLQGLLQKSVVAVGLQGTSDRLLMSEWTHVVDAWQLRTADDYANVPRFGRRSRLGLRQREKLWPIFERVLGELQQRGFETEASIYQKITDHYLGRPDKPFSSILIDEAQDLGVPEIRFFAAIAPEGLDALFFSGDLGQRIFKQPFSWKSLGVDIQGRSSTLRVNYRTSHQIRQAADKLLPEAVSDLDGNKDVRKGTVSVFNGPSPEIKTFAATGEERDHVASFIRKSIHDGVQPAEIAVFVRTRDVIDRARDAVRAAGWEAAEITLLNQGDSEAVRIGVMHLAKGLEFKAVVAMACDSDLLPLDQRVAAAADEVELDDVYATERHLLYVACTRARDRLLITGMKPGSEFLRDL